MGSNQHTPGPWGWFGDPQHGGFYLATRHSGRRYVMGFARMGFHYAQPLFQVDGVMVDGRELCRFEVAPNVIGVTAAKQAGSGVYRTDITEFDHPDARLIAAAPDLLAALNEINNWLVCAAIASPEDMAQSFPHMQAVADAAIAKAVCAERTSQPADRASDQS